MRLGILSFKKGYQTDAQPSRAELVVMHEESSRVYSSGNTIFALAVFCEEFGQAHSCKASIRTGGDCHPVEDVRWLHPCRIRILHYRRSSLIDWRAIFRRLLAVAILSCSIWFWSSAAASPELNGFRCVTFGIFVSVQRVFCAGLRYLSCTLLYWVHNEGEVKGSGRDVVGECMNTTRYWDSTE